MTDSESPTSVQNSDKGGDQKPRTVTKHKRRNPRVIVIPLVVLIVIAILAFQWWRNRPEGRPGWLRCSGRIEGYEVNVGAKIAGRVEFISNREGEQVKTGQLLVKLSDEDIQAQLRGAKARYNEAKKSVSEAEELKQVSEQQVEQAKLSVEQAKQDAEGRIEQAEANVAAAEANVSQAHAQEVQAKADLELARIRKKRYHDLVVKGAVTQDEDDQAASTFESQLAATQARRDAVISSEKQLKSAQGALYLAKSNSLNPPIRFTQKQANMRTVAQNQAALERSKEDVKNAASSVEEIQANIAYLNIPSPIHGVVTARTVEPGAVVAAGQTVISLINLDTVFLRAYVPDSQIGKVRIEQPALVYYDSDPKHGVQGKVIEIDPEASFTPENIYFRDDRVKQVFGIKIMIDNPANFAKPGMPADADIDIRGKSEEKHS